MVIPAMGIGYPRPICTNTVENLHLIIVMGYFTKWIKADAFENIIARNILKFFKRNVLARGRVPQAIVTYNGTQFIDKRLNILLEELKIKRHFKSMEHLQITG